MKHYKQDNEIIRGATGAQYTFMDTSPQAQEVNQIINGICGQLQALATVINNMQAKLKQGQDCGK